MASSTLTPEAVQDALRAVLERGDYPSMAKVRGELDTTASQQTLTGHMKVALKGLAEQMGTGLPEGLPRSVVDAAHRFYSEARDSAREELEKQRALMAEREKSLTDAVAEKSRKADALEQQVGQLQQRAQAAESEAASLAKDLEVSQEALNDSQDRNAHLTSELSDTRSQAARHVRQLRATHRKQTENLVRERQQISDARDREIERADDQQKLWAKQVDEARQEVLSAKAEHAEQIRALRDERDQAIREREENAQSLRDRDRAIEAINADLDKSQSHAADLEASIEQAQTKAASLSESLLNAQSEQNTLREKLAHATAIADERERLLNRLERARDADKEDAKRNPKSKR
ncbi:DNA-binding protein [Salinisphaera aquimarina]|uniref:DNA-binding protein n=1 Tax=Salinisphaera aquimarina TaxID=2094031 RepID=A0ABV7ELX9_9GAMM